MGGGSYSFAGRTDRATTLGYDTKSQQEIFQQRSINSAMSPYGVKFRESRDSEEHPNSLAMILALDETGSMGSVPHFLVKEGFPAIMDKIMREGIQDLQVLFMGVGDHQWDNSPLQVGQFESSDELLDHWLTALHLEGGGGGNDGESYMLAWYFAGYRTEIDCLDKRGVKGILFTVGDEKVLPSISGNSVRSLHGEGEYHDYTAAELLDKAREKYHCFHIHICETGQGSRQDVKDSWKQLMGDNLILAQHREDVAKLIADTVCRVYAAPSTTGVDTTKSENKTVEEVIL